MRVPFRVTELRRYAPSISSTREAPDARNRPIVRNPNESREYGPDAQRSEDVLLTRFDAAALVPVVRGAGGVIGDWHGGTDFEAGSVVAAATPQLYEAAVALLSR